jgi:hypothetical protein
LLELGNYPWIEQENVRGVCVVAVASWLWPLLYQFAQEFSWNRGDSPWHLFDVGFLGDIRVVAGQSTHVTLCPIQDSRVPQGFVGLLYTYPDVGDGEQHRLAAWKGQIGPKGFWTATYTERWLVEQCFPRVVAHVRRPGSSFRFLRFLPCLFGESRQPDWQTMRCAERTALADLNEAMQLQPYLQDLQQWFNTCPVRYLSQKLMFPYYQALVEIMHQLTVTIAAGDRYAWRYVDGAFSDTKEHVREGMDWGQESPVTYEQILQMLDAHVKRVAIAPFEASWQADFLSCAFLWIIRHGQGSCSPNLIQRVAQAIAPLWEQIRFGIAHYR